MQFCPQCGGLMYPRREGGRTHLVCRACGYKLEGLNVNAAYRVKREIQHTERERTIVIESSDNLPRTLSTTKDATCPKCGHGEAYYWFMQTRAADEPPTRFYRCVRCGHVWREYE